jgi:hypothetical protein
MVGIGVGVAVAVGEGLGVKVGVVVVVGEGDVVGVRVEVFCGGTSTASAEMHPEISQIAASALTTLRIRWMPLRPAAHNGLITQVYLICHRVQPAVGVRLPG